MAQTLITPYVAPGQYPAAGLVVVYTAADVANGNYFPSTGRELLIAFNSGVSAYTVTVTSTPDTFGRTATITAESLAAGAYHIYGPLAKTGWADSSGHINIAASNALVLFAVIQIP